MAIRPCILSLAALLFASSCGGESPTQPSNPEPPSFLSGTWRGTVTIERANQPTSSGTTTWTFTVQPGTNRQTFRTSIRVDHPWLAITSTNNTSTAVTPSPDPPAHVSTQGNYASPRGCQGSLASIGDTTSATRIEATFEGVDCGETFRGTVTLTKDQ